MSSQKIEIDPRELRVDIYSNSARPIKNKFGVDNIRITYMSKGIVVSCDASCERHADVLMFNVDRRKCCMSQLKQKLNEEVCS